MVCPAQDIADGRQSFRVSDAARRRKVVGARTRGLQAVIYGDLDFGLLWAVIGAADMRTHLRADVCFSAS